MYSFKLKCIALNSKFYREFVSVILLNWFVFFFQCATPLLFYSELNVKYVMIYIFLIFPFKMGIWKHLKEIEIWIIEYFAALDVIVLPPLTIKLFTCIVLHVNVVLTYYKRFSKEKVL